MAARSGKVEWPDDAVNGVPAEIDEGLSRRLHRDATLATLISSTGMGEWAQAL